MRLASLALAALVAAGLSGAARAQEAAPLPEVHWPFTGLFGTYDQATLKRGFEVYRQICSTCHSMKLLSYRDLEAIGYTPEQVKDIAASVQIQDGPNDAGEMYDRPGRPSDRFHLPFPNDQAARAANNGALPPDMSLLAKAREGGPTYIHALMLGYTDPPAGFKMAQGMNYNKYFPGHQIAMPQPLTDGAVTYSDGTQATLDQEARDVASFLMWTSEPKLDDRKHMGVKVMLFLVVLTLMLYAVKRKIWADVH
jgi:ubiquinol-cytochrome c reductase cytochrome c1 subunit